MDQKAIHNPIIQQTWDKKFIDLSTLPKVVSKKDFRPLLRAAALVLLEVLIFFGAARLVHLW